MSNSRDDDWENRGGAAVADLFRRPRAPYDPGRRNDFDGALAPPDRNGSNRRTRPDSPPRFAPRHLKMRR